jgi:hypothetical protein
MSTHEVVHSFEVLDDLEVHARVVVSPTGKTFLDLREYVPSLKAYGRGLLLPEEYGEDLLDSVELLANRGREIAADE